MKAAKNLKVAPILLVIFGGIFLLNNFGILPWSIWTNLWKFWPLFLILIGIEIFLGKAISWKIVVFLLLLIFLLPLLLAVNPLSGNPLSTQELKINQPLNSLAQAKIMIDLPATNLKIEALKSSSSKLVEGSIFYSKFAEKPILNLDSAFGQGIFKIKQPLFSNNIPFLSSLRNQLNLSLTDQIPLEIQVKSGASQAKIDLTLLRVDRLEIDSQASTISLNLGAQYPIKVKIKTSASTLEIKIPKALEGKVKISSAIKTVSLPDRFEKTGEHFQTDGFETGNLKADIVIEALAGTVTIKEE